LVSLISVSLDVVPALLPSRPSGLNHLVDRAIAFGKISVGKAKRDVVDDFRFLEGQQRLIVAARR
jgi:hypothetical protein